MPAPASRTADAVDLGHLLDDGRWSGYQKWLVFLTALTIIFDGIDNQLLGVSIPTIMTEWPVPRGAFAPVVALGYLGMMLGGAAAGLAGDRFGRRTALLRQHGRCSARPRSAPPRARSPVVSRCCASSPGSASAARCPTPRRWRRNTCPGPAVHRGHADHCLRAARRDDRRPAREPGAGAARAGGCSSIGGVVPLVFAALLCLPAAGIAALPGAPPLAAARAGPPASAHGPRDRRSTSSSRISRSAPAPRAPLAALFQRTCAATPWPCGARSCPACCRCISASAGCRRS